MTGKTRNPSVNLKSRLLLGTFIAVAMVVIQYPHLPLSLVEAAPPQQEIPPGQLKRRSLSGTIVARTDSSITVGTKFGNVVVSVGPDTVVAVHWWRRRRRLDYDNDTCHNNATDHRWRRGR